MFGTRSVAVFAVAAALGSGSVAVASAADGPGADRLAQVNHIVVIYQENHSFDNLYGGLGGGARSQRAPTPAHTVQVNQAGTPYTCLLQNDVNLAVAAAAGDVHGHDHRHLVHEPLRERAVRDRQLHPADRDHLPGAGRVRAQRRAQRHRPARRLHARPGAPLLPGAVPARRRQAGSLRHRQRRGRAHDGLLRHPDAADLRLPARRRAIRATRSPTCSSSRRSAARS